MSDKLIGVTEHYTNSILYISVVQSGHEVIKYNFYTCDYNFELIII